MSASIVSKSIFKTASISFFFNAFYSGVFSYNLDPKRIVFLIASGNSLVELNFRSISILLKYFNNRKGGDLENSGEILSATFFNLSPNCLLRLSFISPFKFEKTADPSLFP